MAVINKVIKNRNKKNRVHVDDPLAAEKIYLGLVEKFGQYNILTSDPIVLVCIGTDRSTGDCLGPLVGTQLSYKHNDFFYIYGTLEQPVHAGNLKECIDDIQQRFKNPFIIALDACLGSLENVGYISIGDGSLQPGAGVNKSLPPVGHIHITGIVNIGGFMEYLVLQNTRLNLVMKMSQAIVQALIKISSENQQDKARSC